MRLAVANLRLERWEAADLEELHEAVSSSHQHLVAWMPWADRVDRGSQARFLRESSDGWERGERFEYAIRDAHAVLLGSIGAIHRIAPGGLEIGYWLHVAHTRRGIATLAAAALTEAALDLAATDHVEIHHDEANAASGRVAERLGFSRTGSAPQRRSAPGEIGVEVRWRMSEDAWPQSAARGLLDRARGGGGGGG